MRPVYNAQANIRLPRQLLLKFQKLIDEGNYNKSAVIRQLLSDWCDEKAAEDLQ